MLDAGHKNAGRQKPAQVTFPNKNPAIRDLKITNAPDANLSIKEVFMDRNALDIIKLCTAIGDVMEMTDAQAYLPNQSETQRYAGANEELQSLLFFRHSLFEPANFWKRGARAKQNSTPLSSRIHFHLLGSVPLCPRGVFSRPPNPCRSPCLGPTPSTDEKRQQSKMTSQASR